MKQPGTTPEVSPFTALADQDDPAAWRDLPRPSRTRHRRVLAGPRLRPPPGWERVGGLPGVQLTGAAAAGAADPEAVVLGAADVPEILDLVERAKPGRSCERTVELGTYPRGSAARAG